MTGGKKRKKKKPGSQLQFIPKVSDGIEVRALCGPVKFFRTKMGK